jgi:SAM-dependent methyltransferase
MPGRDDHDPPPTAEFSSPSEIEVADFLKDLGLKDVHDFGAALAELPAAIRTSFQNVERSSRSILEVLAHAYGHRDLIGIVVGQDFHMIHAAAGLLVDLPPLAPGARILDVGGGPGHLALWMLRRWPSTSVTVLDPIASAVARDWTPALVGASIRFVSGAAPSNMSGIAGEQFDRIVIARTLAQGSGPENSRAFCRSVIKALCPLVAEGGDLVVIDHFHGRDKQMTDSIAAAARQSGFPIAKGWRIDPHVPWQIRFVRA